MSNKFHRAFMNVAKEFASLSSAKKLQVGAILVREGRILSVGYNGTPAGWDNECEDTIHHHDIGVVSLSTKSEVIHAEMNVLMKIAASNESSKGSTLYCTHTPCIDCAKAIYQAGISKVFVNEEYNAGRGKGEHFLNKCEVEIEYLPSQSESV